jgi:hypothetical protein
LFAILAESFGLTQEVNCLYSSQLSQGLFAILAESFWILFRFTQEVNCLYSSQLSQGLVAILAGLLLIKMALAYKPGLKLINA